jgi:pimeloyl-ACP methyl ester carboxylesterase
MTHVKIGCQHFSRPTVVSSSAREQAWCPRIPASVSSGNAGPAQGWGVVGAGSCHGWRRRRRDRTHARGRPASPRSCSGERASGGNQRSLDGPRPLCIRPRRNLNTVVRSARRLCRADVAQIHLVDGEMYASPTRPDCRTSSSHTCRTTRWSSTGRPSSGAVGAHDILCGPAWARPILAGIGQAELITFERSGHVPQYEQPDEFRTAVLAWYARCVESA